MEAFGMDEHIDWELFDMSPIPEKDLADVIWNVMQNEGYLSMYYVTNRFRHDGTPDEINAALDSLLDRGRAYMTPAGTRMRCLWGWQRGRPGE
jgi:hypothetical protein